MIFDENAWLPMGKATKVLIWQVLPSCGSLTIVTEEPWKPNRLTKETTYLHTILWYIC